MSPEEEGDRTDKSPTAIRNVFNRQNYPIITSPSSDLEPCSRNITTIADAVVDTTITLDSIVSSKHPVKSPSNSPSSVGDVEKFDGKIVYNSDGSAYIIEGESELSDDESLPEGCIVDGRGISMSHSLVLPQIANAYYVSRLYAHQIYQGQNQQKSSILANTEFPVMYSYRVIDHRSRERGSVSLHKSATKKNSSIVPVKPILMCFICKLSFGHAKSFVAHALGEHQINFFEDEKKSLSSSTTSAIVQAVGKNKQAIVSFLEPVSSPSCILDSKDSVAVQNSNDEASVKNVVTLKSKKSKSLDTKLEKYSSETKSATSTSITAFAHQEDYNIHKYSHVISNQTGSYWSSLSENVPPTNTSLSGTLLKSSTACISNLNPPNFQSGTTIGVCSEHMQGRPSGIECTKCETILANNRIPVTTSSTSGIHSRNSCKTLKCPKCNWHYKYQETLEIHMKEKHPDSETSCIYCIASQPHPRLARGETYTCGYKPYRCEVCNYSTTTKGNLSIHMQSDKHLNNMQELQQGNSNLINPSSPQDSSVQTQASVLQQSNNNQLPISQGNNQMKPKSMFRCDACNYETTVARNMRIHMTSEKHTHHMLIMQQNIKHMHTLSQSHQLNSHQKQTTPHYDQPENNSTIIKSQSNEIALADMAYNQALLVQMMTGSLSPQINTEIIGNLSNVNSLCNFGMDIGTSSESMEPPPEPSNPNPLHLYQCCVCSKFETDSIEELGFHLALDRSKIQESEILSNISGYFICKLCSYKTNLKANFQLHCKTDKHIQRLQHLNHVKEGGPRNEWKLKYLASPTTSAQIRCHACDYYTNNIHKLALHAATSKHEAASILLQHILEASATVSSECKIYHCILCGFNAKTRLSLLQHVKTVRHLQMEQLRQLQVQTGMKNDRNIQTDIGEIFQVLPDDEKKEVSIDNAHNESDSNNQLHGNDSDECDIKQELENENEPDNDTVDSKFSHGTYQSLQNIETESFFLSSKINNYEDKSLLRKEVNGSFSCPLCQDNFQFRTMLEKHVMQIHSVNSDGLQRLLHLVNQSHWLNTSSRKTDESYSFLKSLNIISTQENDAELVEQIADEDLFKCNFCSRSCSSAEELQIHNRESHSASVPSLAVSTKHVYKYRCGQCSLAFKTFDKLQQHSQYHVIRDSTKCGICFRSFRTIQSLHRHIDSSHTELQEDEIVQFKNALISSQTFFQDISEEHSNHEELCISEQFVDEEEKDDDEVDMNDTSSIAKEQRLLESYLNSQSIAEDFYNDSNRKFKCHRCKVAFTRQCYLTSHNKSLIHRRGDKISYPMEKYLDPNRPYKCDICKESFTQKNILLVHYNSVSHLHKLKRAMQDQSKISSYVNCTSPSPTDSSENEQDKKPYKCNICKVSYSQGSTLDIHKRSVLHQSRANKIHDLAVSGQLDLTRPLIEQPFSNNALSISKNSDNACITCYKCNAIFNSQEQLEQHLESYCANNNGIYLCRKSSSKQSELSLLTTPPPSVSSSETQDKTVIHTHSQQAQSTQENTFLSKPKSSPIYKHLLESFGFDLVMQFNENHEKRQRRNIENCSSDYELEHKYSIDKNEYGTTIVNEKDFNSIVAASVISDLHKSICQQCNKEFSSIWVLKAHCEEVHKDLVPQEFLEKYAQHFKTEYDKKVVVVTAATSSSTASGPLNSTSTLLSFPDESKHDIKEKNEIQDTIIKSLEPTSTTPITTPTTSATPVLSNTPVSSTDSVATIIPGSSTQNSIQHHNQQAQISFAQHITEVQAALSAMAATQFQHQIQQYPSLIMGMMGLPLGINVPALAAMNLQPPLVPVVLSPTYDGNNSGFSSLDTQSELVSKQNFPMCQPQNANSGNGTSNKRARTRITDDQLKILRGHFDINNSPGEDQIANMAAQSGLPPKVIKHWFRNTLFKERQRNKDSPYNFNNPPSTTLNVEEYEKTGEAKVTPLITFTSSSITEKKDEEKNVNDSSSIDTDDIIQNEIKQVNISNSVMQQEDRTSGESSGEQQSGTHSPITPSNLNHSQDSSIIISGNISETLSMLPPKTISQNCVTYSSVNNGPPNNHLSQSNQLCNSPPRIGDFSFHSNNSINPTNSSGSGKRANRTRFTDYQIKVLQEFFENNAYPKDDDLEYLSKLLGLSPRVIVVWFQNARQKARKVYENQPQTEPLVSGGRDIEDNTGRFQRTPGLNYQCKKCLLIFQRYYELIRHQKTHCFKEEDAKRSAQAQAAAAQVAAVLSSEDSNSSSNTTIQTLQSTSMNISSASDLSSNAIISQQSSLSQNLLASQTVQPDTKPDDFQCDKCNLVFSRFELWREHQLVHIMNPSLFSASYSPESAFGILQQHAIKSSSLSMDFPQFSINTSQEKKRPFEDLDESQNSEIKLHSDQLEHPKDKRLRTTILPEQLDYLYQKYQIESNPSRKMLETIAKEVGLKKRVVQVWFQNTRARERKGQFRAHSQVINKRCPFCPALFKVKSALETHLTNKHADNISKIEINIDSLPDEELSLESCISNSSTPNIISPLFSGNMEAEASLKKYYEESMKRYITEFQINATKKQDLSSSSFPTIESPLDLSKPNDSINTLNAIIDSNSYTNEQNFINSMKMNVDGQISDIIEKSSYEDDEITEYIDDECPMSPTSQTFKQSVNTSYNNIIVYSGNGNTPIGGSKRYRTQMTTTQVKVMKSLFSDYKTPTMTECEVLGKEISLPKRVVQVWFQNARAKEKKAKLAAGLATEGFPIHQTLTGPEQCKLCSIRYSAKLSLQEHIFSKQHIESVRSAVDNGSLIPPTPGAPIQKDNEVPVNNSNMNDDFQSNQFQTEENVMYGSLFLQPTSNFQSQKMSQHKNVENTEMSISFNSKSTSESSDS